MGRWAKVTGLIMIGILAFVLASNARIPTPEEANSAVLTLREYEGWAWAVGIALIWADVALPVPQTAVIAALGIIYGTLIGGLLGSLALVTGGLLGYVLMRTSARRFMRRLLGPQSLQKIETMFGRGGAWAIVVTRSLPYSIPEAMVFLAGLAGMPMRKFTAALITGSLPAAFAFAAIGAGWADQPALALVVSYVLPILLLPVALLLMRLRKRQWGANRAPVVANLAAFGSFYASLVFSGSLDGRYALPLALSGCLVALVGVAIVLMSRAELGAAWSLVPKADTSLVTTGPYRFVRHPIYLGFTVLAIGQALAFSSWAALLIVPFAIVPTFAWRARAEETLLSRAFGERYEAYRQRTSMIIPSLL